TIYRTLPNATVLSKDDLIRAYTDNINAINQNVKARAILEVMTDIGTGADGLSKVIQDYANTDMLTSMDNMRNRFKKVLAADTEAIKALQEAPLVKKLSPSQERLVGKMASSEDFLMVLSDERQIRDLFDMYDSL